MKSFRVFFFLVTTLITTTFFSLAVHAADSNINLNTATAEQLADTMVGVGSAKAKAIITYRESHGPFKTVDELVYVKGIGESLVEKNRTNLSVK
ncbi:ComEA family DNA-binding protein [bacterium]|nr:ComEA family DNA-binding protein [bacterium]